MSYWRKIFNPWFIVVLLLAALHQILEKLLNLRLPFADNYLDPLLLMPILLHLVLWERRILLKKGVHYVFSFPEAGMLFLVVSFVTEYLFPIWHSGFTADWRDVICYAIGTLTYYYCFNRPYKEDKLKNASGY